VLPVVIVGKERGERFGLLDRLSSISSWLFREAMLRIFVHSWSWYCHRRNTPPSSRPSARKQKMPLPRSREKRHGEEVLRDRFKREQERSYRKRKSMHDYHTSDCTHLRNSAKIRNKHGEQFSMTYPVVAHDLSEWGIDTGRYPGGATAGRM
jgi:hypothetical protein